MTLSIHDVELALETVYILQDSVIIHTIILEKASIKIADLISHKRHQILNIISVVGYRQQLCDVLFMQSLLSNVK